MLCYLSNDDGKVIEHAEIDIIRPMAQDLSQRDPREIYLIWDDITDELFEVWYLGVQLITESGLTPFEFADLQSQDKIVEFPELKSIR